MIPYHGTPITPNDACAATLTGGHAFVSFRRPDQLPIAVEVCKTFAIDNGAFSAWKSGEPVQDWSEFYRWAHDCHRIPTCDFAVIPDVIDGDEDANNALLAEWPLPKHFGAPVWHMHESLDRLFMLMCEYPRICLGSSGQFATVGTPAWWAKINEAMHVVCDNEGRPMVKLHGLRMLNPRIFTRIPFASCDSTNIAQNIGIDSAWRGTYTPPSKAVRAQVMRARIESQQSPARWTPYELS